MNPTILPQEMNFEAQQYIIRMLFELPDKMEAIKKKFDEGMKAIAELEVSIREAELDLEKTRTEATQLPEFAECKNDTQRKAFIFKRTEHLEKGLTALRNNKLMLETANQAVKSEYDSLSTRLWAVKTASAQIAAAMNLLAANE